MEYQHINRWSRPSHYMGESWPDYYSSGVGQSRDSDALERSNFVCMLKELGGESETVFVIRESHWAVGWVEWIAIHESDDKALAIADQIKGKLDDYPVIDEEHMSELEWTEAADYWDSMSPRSKVEYAMGERARMHWHAKTPVWRFGRMDYCALANDGSDIAESITESLRSN